MSDSIVAASASASAAGLAVTRDLMFTKPVLTMPAAGQIFAIILFGVGALVTLWYAIRVARRDRYMVPIWLYLGSLLASTYETYDATLGHFLYPQVGQATAYELLGVTLPWFLVFIYPIYVAALVIWIFDRLQNHRLSTSLWWKMYGVSVVGAAAFETPFTYYGLWNYFGENQPIKIFDLPVWWIFANPAAVMCMGLLCSYVWNELLDRRKGSALIVVLPLSLFALHGSISAPLYFALNSSPDKFVTNAGALITIVLSLGLAWLGARFVAKSHTASPSAVPSI